MHIYKITCIWLLPWLFLVICHTRRRPGAWWLTDRSAKTQHNVQCQLNVSHDCPVKRNNNKSICCCFCFSTNNKHKQRGALTRSVWPTVKGARGFSDQSSFCVFIASLSWLLCYCTNSNILKIHQIKWWWYRSAWACEYFSVVNIEMFRE